MDYRGLVVADDLTGGADTGHRLAARGHDVAVAGVDRRPDASVLVRNTDSRYSPPEEAGRRVAAAIDGLAPDVVYKKVDSTLRGNVVVELEAALEATRADIALVAPAFPANGRTTVGGYHLVGGTPVARTEAGADPNAPVETSSLMELLSVAEHPVRHLTIGTVSRGADAVRDRLAGYLDSTAPVIVACDATRDEHLEAIARAGAALDAGVLYAGSAGLAGHVRLGASNEVLGVVGSTAEETLSGLEAVPASQVVRIDGPLAIREPGTAIDRAATAATEAIGQAERAIVTAAHTQADVRATVEAGREAGLSEPAVRDRIASSLGRVARAVVDRRGVDGLFLTGGATAAAVLEALDGGELRLTGRSVEAGIPIGRLEGGIADDLPVVTRAGAFGDRETILSCVDDLAAYDG